MMSSIKLTPNKVEGALDYQKTLDPVPYSFKREIAGAAATAALAYLLDKGKWHD